MDYIKGGRIKTAYLFIAGIMLFLYSWFAQTTDIDIPFVDFSNVISVVLILILFVTEWLYVVWFRGNWKVFIIVEPVIVFICLDPLHLYQNTFLGKCIQKSIMYLFGIDSVYVYKCCQSNISFCCGIILIIYLILSVLPFMAVDKELKKV